VSFFQNKSNLGLVPPSFLRNHTPNANPLYGVDLLVQMIRAQYNPLTWGSPARSSALRSPGRILTQTRTSLTKTSSSCSQHLIWNETCSRSALGAAESDHTPGLGNPKVPPETERSELPLACRRHQVSLRTFGELGWLPEREAKAQELGRYISYSEFPEYLRPAVWPEVR
jgi:hypothetical protein